MKILRRYDDMKEATENLKEIIEKNLIGYEKRSDYFNALNEKINKLLENNRIDKEDYEIFMLFELNTNGKAFIYKKLVDNLRFELGYGLQMPKRIGFYYGQNAVWNNICNSILHTHLLMSEKGTNDE